MQIERRPDLRKAEAAIDPRGEWFSNAQKLAGLSQKQSCERILMEEGTKSRLPA
jgi:hypothetical protein